MSNDLARQDSHHRDIPRALVWAFFTVQNYVLRTNWKTEYDKYKAAYKEASAKRQEDYNRHIAAEELLPGNWPTSRRAPPA